MGNNMDLFLLLLILLLFVFIVQKITMPNQIVRAIFIGCIFLLSLKNKQQALILSILFMILITNSQNNTIDLFGNMIQTNKSKIQTKYCVPAKNGVCKSPLNNSLNDSNWCCIGSCYCNQPCPPTTCQKKYSWGTGNDSCPSKGQVISADNPNMCCYGNGCKCNKNPG